MLYYRMRKNRNTKSAGFKTGIFLFVLSIWISWLFCEIPIRTYLSGYLSSPKAVVSKGNVMLATHSSSPEPVPTEEIFTEPAVGVLTSPFGERWGRTHEGIDIGGDHGSDILAADGGVVLLSQWVEGYGNYIEVDHGNGYKTVYGHCEELLVASGDLVSKGQAIATMGSTGNSTGPHLHFEILLNGEPQNPLNYVIY